MNRVRFSVLEDVRRLFLAELDFLPAAQRARVAARLAACARDAGLLAGSVEQYYTAVQVGRLLDRGPDWVSQKAREGALGAAAKDDGGWLIPASGVNDYLARHAVPVVVVQTPAVASSSEVAA